MDFGAATHPGRVRSGNEDGFFASREQAVFAVADGMGGHEHGEVASHLALDTITRYAAALSVAGPSDLANLLHDAVQEANTAILSQAVEQDARLRMGTTLVLVTICGDRLYFAHIGDSRLYLLRGTVFTQLTRDHSLVQSMVDRGEISSEEAAIHPLRHQITRVVGGDDRVSPEIASQALEPGDLILLCTDGLSGAVEVEAIKAILREDTSTQAKADALVNAALDAGGPDNVTAVVINYQQPRPLPRPQEQPVRKRALWPRILITIACVLALVAAIGGALYTRPMYTVASNSHGILTLYRSWPLLPLLKREQVPLPRSATEVTLSEARPYLSEYNPIDGDITVGIRVEGKDAGIALLHDLIKNIGSGLLQQSKSALEQHQLADANNYLTRARALHADPQLIQQLEIQLQQQQNGMTHPAPKPQ